jgi:hypothetical protein
LRIGESRDSGFDASHRPGMTMLEVLLCSLKFHYLEMNISPRSRGAFHARVMQSISPSRIEEGAGNAG